MEAPLAIARELEERDALVSAEIDAVAALQDEATALRASAEEVDEFLARLPAAREQAADAASAAAAELERRRRARTEAEAAAEAAAKPEEAAEARRRLVRARDAEASEARILAARRAAAEGLEAEARAVEARAGALPAEAGALAERVASLRRAPKHLAAEPWAGPADVAAWATRAGAALFVVRGGLDRDREALLREANELAAGVLGDAGASSVALVRRRLESALRT
jgi:hypothetical protein